MKQEMPEGFGSPAHVQSMLHSIALERNVRDQLLELGETNWKMVRREQLKNDGLSKTEMEALIDSEWGEVGLAMRLSFNGALGEFTKSEMKRLSVIK